MYMLRAIMEGRYSFSSPEWNDISDPPKDLVSISLQITDLHKHLVSDQRKDHNATVMAQKYMY